MTDLNILIVSGLWHPEPKGGGVQSSVCTLVDGLSKRHSVTVLVPRWQQESLLREDLGAITVYRRRIRNLNTGTALPVRAFLMWLLNLPRTLWDLRRIIREHHIDAIHLYQLHSSQLTFAVGRLLGGPPYVASFHGRDVRDYPDRSWLERAVIRLLVRRASGFTAVSEDLAVLAQRQIPGVKNISVVRNGVSVPCELTSTVQTNLLDRMPSKYFINVGRFYPMSDFALKGQDLVIQAWGKLSETFPDVHLVMVGDALESDDYLKLATDCGAKKTVHILGTLPRQHVLSIMKGAIGLITASRSEGGGPTMTILEAGSFELPVIASNIPAHSESLCHEVDCLIVPPEDPESILQAVIRLLENPALSRNLGQALSRKVRDNNSAAHMAAAYVDQAYLPALEP